MKLGLVTAAVMAFAGSSAQAATLLAAPAAANCLAGGCIADGRLTQTFSASTFAGLTGIGSVSFDRSLLGQNHAFRLTFWNASGTMVGDFGNFDVSVLGGDRLTLAGREFAWDSSQGDLTMRFEIARPAGSGGGGGFFGGGGGGGPAMSFASEPMDRPSGAFIAEPSRGQNFLSAPLVSNLAADVVLAVPDAPSWALMILGFGGAGAALRRRRKGLIAT